MSAYYNDNEPFVAEWLRRLIAAGHLPAGDVDERSICDVRADDLKGYSQCHFFAGIGGWPLALRMAGWPDDRPVWTGSCPCQPLSSAGQRKGHADERHLWPAFFRIIAERRPPAVFGEQVASALGREWLAAVRADLEDLEYAVGVADLCAAGVGAPHIRQRLWRVADRLGPRLEERREQHAWTERAPVERDGALDFMAFPDGRERRSWRPDAWADLEWLPCRDGLARPTQPGIHPLAHGIPGRMGRLRAYGNAIVPQVAAELIAAVMECRPG
ncbi:DNA cytosine methyltransferase [Roseomonas alkaliterrae]|uniref:DNA cytosine methyltransferase n=1 Tax=Neoroseomonas alkaliterrae TaxID=1452450 RepID=UPI001BA80620|nr:DNA cytosine methyltransferase [Neoroseomonas alkaliterrae]MBR0676656.1 DNA cytosine methyltransferase [Neoroseomonas alkaliterrae]